MRAVIIGAGEIRDYNAIKSRIHENDYIICADGGALHAEKMGIKPDIIIGDFDSCGEEKIEGNIVKYPVRKDLTDGELCVRYALEHGFDTVLLLAMTGDRMDHTLTDIFLLSQIKNGCIINEDNEIYLVRDRLKIKNKKGKTLSIIPVYGELSGITTYGLEYPLHDETLYFGKSRGNSNVITEEECGIEVRSGMGLVVINDGK